ncbi:MAG: hypothetical protein AAGD28_16745 [Bacteroidota bacterium]
MQRAHHKAIILCLLIHGFLSISLYAQGDSLQWNSMDERIFSSYLELGYVGEISEQLEGGRLIKSAFEFRLRGSNHLFFRANYDEYSSSYRTDLLDKPKIVLDNHANISDAILGLGYRFGKNNYRLFMLGQAGLKFYSLPAILSEVKPEVLYMEDGFSIPTSRLTVGIEYYLDSSFALSLEIFQNSVWEKKDYWKNRFASFGISIGLQGTFF